MPTLALSDPCTNISKQYIPPNATRDVDIPLKFYNGIALAPWISQNCTKSFLNAANYYAVAFITYVPDNKTETPPPTSDPQWGLNDGGRWKSSSQFPVYAIAGSSGFALMQQLGVYSGNVSSTKNGTFDSLPGGPDDFIRLYMSVQTNARSNLPSLWAFLLMVLGIVLFLVALTSFAMHFYQRRARNGLRRRVVRGEVDLETLGIRRLTVPQPVLDKLPVYTYNAAETTQPILRRNSEPMPSSPVDDIAANPAATPQAFQQPTCAICLDDFVSNSTTVKELPCKHIFHPECIDELLKGFSSLCPVCKGKVLPNGYCPETITNTMVRRERQARRFPPPEQAAQTPPPVAPAVEPSRRRFQVHNRMASFHRQFGRASRSAGERRIFSAPEPQSIEMQDTTPATTTSPQPGVPPEPRSPEQPSMDRTERARRRVSALLGHQVMADEEEREGSGRRPKCTFCSHLSSSPATDMNLCRASSDGFCVSGLSMTSI